ncbi:MAG: c-type cytochrome biogenesis protein CcmI [Burkholderiales bacterium]|nr:c-type cytochrome biogenesis protein CcmI [Burkholderiales bacterium]
MTAFLIASGLLIAGALLFIVPPLLRSRPADRVSRKTVNITLYRDQLKELDADLQSGTLSAEHYEKARRELEARLLEDVDAGDAMAGSPRHGRASAIALGLALPLCAVALYLAVGNPQALAPHQAADARGPAHDITPQQIEEMVQRLATRLQNNPDNVEGWIMLARAYNALGRFAQAASAYASAIKQLPNDAQLLADYADTLAMAQDRRLQGEPEKLIARALQIDPDNIKALALAGSLAFDNKNYAKAVEYWERILRLVPQDSEFARSVSASVAEARTLGKGSASAAPRDANAAASKRGVSGVVKLAPELAAKVAPTDTVFIFARAAEGPRIPLAILRKQARELPVTFSLDDSMAMAPGASLSSFPQVVIGARVSKSANANPQPGDLQGVSAPIANSASGITVVIDSEIR